MSALKVIIDSGDQTLRVMRAGSSIFKAPVSTSQYGLGYEPGSLKTPTGLFHIAEKIGQESPLGTVFKGRVPVSEPIDWENEPDLITSRILWLDGLQEANANTKDRYIYIHGTNQEALIGQPASHGCIRMRNRDIIRLFDLVEVGTEIEIIG
jgi:L,D-transpeptidase-like protein